MTENPDAFQRLIGKFSDQRWRLNSLYRIIDKDGKEVPFRMNPEQEKLYEDRHYQNVILKARQLGFSTFIAIFMLDCCLFDKNTACGIVDATIDDAKGKLAKIKFAYDGLPGEIKEVVPLTTANAYELAFGNGSSIKAGTSHRGGTLQILHVSEYGKICAKYPDRAREVRTGSLNTVQAGQIVFIESTAEGAAGGFYETCQLAEAKKVAKTKLTPLDFKFHFFPWWAAAEYAVEPAGVELADEDKGYFAGIEAVSGPLSDGQKAWYIKKRETQREDMKREFPSTPKEAFEAAVEGAYYARLLATAEMQGRIGNYPHNPELPVYVGWDIGVGDDTTLWFVQRTAGWYNVIDHYATNGQAASHYVQVCEKKAYTYATHFLPHDADNREWGGGKKRIDTLRGLKGNWDWRVLPSVPVDDGINAVRTILPLCRFNEATTAEGLKSLRQYRREYDEGKEVFKPTPLHNWASHDADAFRYLAMGIEPEAAIPPDIPRYSGRRWRDQSHRVGSHMSA